MANISRRFFLWAGLAEMAQAAYTQVPKPKPVHKKTLKKPGQTVPTAQAALSPAFDWIGCYPKAGLARSDGRSSETREESFNQKRLVSYLARRQKILSPESVILKTTSATQASWQKMLGTVDTMDDRLAQANTIFRWIRKNIAHDGAKSDRSGLAAQDLEWFQAPQDTLSSGKGVCIDKALLAMESLRLVGFAKKDIAIEYMLIYNLDGTPRLGKDGQHQAHAVVALRIDDRKYVMDLTDRVGLWHEAQYYWPGGITGHEIMKPFLATGFDGSTNYQKNYVGQPSLTEEEKQTVVAKYSAADKARYESIPGLPPLQSYEVAPAAYWQNAPARRLNQVIMTSPTSGCVGTPCKFN